MQEIFNICSEGRGEEEERL